MAKSNGPTTSETVFAFDQLKSPPSTEPGPWGSASDRGGYCLGLSMIWAHLQLKGATFPHNSGLVDMPPWAATMVYSYYDQCNPLSIQPNQTPDYSARQTARVQTAAELAGLQLGLQRLLLQGLGDCVNVDFGKILERRAGVYLIGLNNRKYGGHAVAMSHVRKNDHFHWFDPNLGHFAFGSGTRMQEAILPSLKWTATMMRLHDSTSLYRVEKLGFFGRIRTWLEK